MELKLFTNFITKNIRFSNRNALVNALNNATPLPAIQVDGCNITNTSSYVDIHCQQSDYNLFNCTYLFVKNGVVENGGNYYLGFIDRVEPNNFNGQEQDEYEVFYRIYFTVDWWSTIMYNDTYGTQIDNIKERLEGNVERAHINDIGADGKVNLDYTLLEPEYYIDKYKRSTVKLNGDRKYAYIFTTKKTSGDTPFRSTPNFIIGDKSIRSGLSCVIGVPSDYIMHTVYTDGNNNPRIYRSVATFRAPDALDDSSIVGIYLTDYMPFDTIEYEGFDCLNFGSYTEDIEHPDSSSIETVTTPFDLSNIWNDGLNAGGVILRDVPETALPFYDYYTKGQFNYYRSNNYNVYLSSIPKQYFAPYRFVTIEKGDSKIPIDTAHLESWSNIKYNVVPYISGYIFYIPTETSSGENAYHILTDDSLYGRTSTNDNFTKLSAMSDSLKFLGKAITAGATLGVGVASGGAIPTIAGIAGMSGLAGEGVRSYSANKKILRDGESGTKLVSNSASDYVAPLCVCFAEPTDEEKDALRRDLALYGYNTYLHPHTILQSHKRDYFNYIKTNNAQLNITSFNTGIRLQIEEMFNNGVWLWNTATNFGNFEVPNYPIIME